MALVVSTRSDGNHGGTDDIGLSLGWLLSQWTVGGVDSLVLSNGGKTGGSNLGVTSVVGTRGDGNHGGLDISLGGGSIGVSSQGWSSDGSGGNSGRKLHF